MERRGVVATAAVMMVLVLGGCTDSDDERDDGTGTTGGENGTGGPVSLNATRVPIDLPTCSLIEVFTTVDVETVRALIPQPFEPVVTGDQALAVLGALVCDGASLPTERGFLAISVEPTDDRLRADGDANHFWEPEHILMNGTAYADNVTALGGIFEPATSIVVTSDATGGEFTVTTQFGTHQASVDGAAPSGTLAGHFGHFREYSAAEGGFTYLEATYAEHEDSLAGAGLGEYETMAGPTQQIFGSSGRAATLFGSDITFGDASLGFIPWSAE